MRATTPKMKAMRMKSFCSRILGVLFFGALSFGLYQFFSVAQISIGDFAFAENKKEVFYQCLKQKEVRWIRIGFEKNGKCKTVYSKYGTSSGVASAYNYSSCEEILNNIKGNLEKGGFACSEKTLVGSIDLDVE